MTRVSDRESLERALMTRLSPLARRVQRVADEALAEMGVSHSAGWALIWLGRLQSDAKQRDLARVLDITEASLVRTLDQLEGAGLVSRRSDPEDRRTNRLALTQEGARLTARIDARLSALRADLLENIGSADLETAIRVLDHVTVAIDNRREKA